MRSYKILIIDDEPENIQVIFNYLKKENYNLLITTNGTSGYNIASKENPDLIITDWEMPGLSGIETIKLIRENPKTKNIPIIMATGKMLSSQDLKIALEAGANDYIRKPIDEIELIARTQSILKISEYNLQLIEAKNKELTEKTLLLIKNNKFNILITKKIKELDCRNKKSEEIIKFIINEINKKIKEDSWVKFHLAFETVHKDFIKNLISKYPTLTNSELKLCIFLKLGMSTKDISIISYKTADSIKVARHRLRQKMRLTTKQSLTAILSSF